jgi:hypothetical protein
MANSTVSENGKGRAEIATGQATGMTTIARQMSMKTIARKTTMMAFLGLMLVGIILQSGSFSAQNDRRGEVFSYDKAESSGARPWTSKDFRNNPDNFQFAILGDRGGGASPLGTYERAIEQLNWMQPEFVMSVGDYIEGYTTSQKALDEQWDEFEAIILDTEDAERPMPPNMERDIETYNRLKREDPQKALAFLKEWMKTPEAQEAFGEGAKVEFPEKQRAWFKKVLADSPQAGPAQLEKLLQDPQAANAKLGGGKAEEGFKEAYREFVTLPSARRAFGKLFLSLGDKEKLPALFHCTTGKDRTGWAAAAFLTLLGVPRETVMEDYLRSNDYLLPAYQKASTPLSRAAETLRSRRPSWA